MNLNVLAGKAAYARISTLTVLCVAACNPSPDATSQKESALQPAAKTEIQPEPKDKAPASAEKSEKPRFSAGGRWTGHFKLRDLDDEFWGIIAEDGTAAFTTEFGGIFWGRVKVEDKTRSLSAAFDSYREGKKESKLLLEGRVVPQKSIVGMIELQEGKLGDKAPFVLQYEEGYDVPESMHLLEGTWVHRNSTIRIEKDGSLTGKTRDNCTLGGKVTLRDPRFVAFDLTLTLSDCPRSGTFSGLLGLDFEMEKNDTLNFVVAGDSAAHADHLHREGTKAAARVHEKRKETEEGKADANDRESL